MGSGFTVGDAVHLPRRNEYGGGNFDVSPPTLLLRGTRETALLGESGRDGRKASSR